MKKLILLTFIVICCILVIPCKIYAMDIAVGATTWLAWGSRFDDVQKTSVRENGSYAFDPTFLYGPALSAKFSDDFNLTFVYLYGKFNYNEKIYADAGGSYYAESKAVRSDSDLALNYRLSDYFKVFIGTKYMAYEVNSSFLNYSGTYCESHSKHTSIGPGMGFTGTFPVIDNIFLLGTVSGFYLFSAGETFVDNGIYGKRPADLTIGYNEYGINSTASIAYYIAPASTVISLGARFQYFIIKYNKYEPFFLINSIENRIYGITLTATYSFSI